MVRRLFRSLLAGLVVAGIVSRAIRRHGRPCAARGTAAPPVYDYHPAKEQESVAAGPSAYRWAVAIILTGAAVIGLFFASIEALAGATSTPSAPLPNGGLYLYVDKPGVAASLDVDVQLSRKDRPDFSASVSLSDSKARFALIGQGPWAITGSSIEHPGGFVPGSASRLPHDAPSVIMVGSSGIFFIEGKLRQRVTAIGAGQVAGFLPAVFAVGASTPMLTGISGRWQKPRSTDIKVSVPNEFGAMTIISANPPSSNARDLTWSGKDYIEPMSWLISDPVDQGNQQAALLLIGTLVGVWASLVVTIVTFFLKSWLRRSWT